MISKFEQLPEFVPNIEIVSLDCGHWIQQEKPEETTQAIISWLGKKVNESFSDRKDYTSAPDKSSY
ncbi:epoxide hydrolase-like protein [Reinekea forsetii]|jgi:hypothetical protein|uniref:Epoxide hydrolase-like protein n=1 Tax=Reinekea forsetii TaxID=1336806 RepID=A0A2K8KUQ1_9GAMM|nr:epoxide hydrolase-like protein [Reinekea forsetii]